MGLAPYGNKDAAETKKFETIIRNELVSVKEDGSVWLNPQWFTYSTGLRMVNDSKWETLFGFPRRKPEEEMKQHHCNLAMAIQVVTEDIVLKMAEHAQKVTGEKNICLAGGVALNCVANGKLAEAKLFDGIFVQPASGDAGGALGAALAAWHISYGKPRTADGHTDAMRGSYLGPSFTETEIEGMIRKRKAIAQPMRIPEVAQLLSQGNVIGWFQGRMEFGPRALGNRSIIGDARNEEMQKKMNLKIKYRESFRPFAPSVLAERAKEYFDLVVDSPYMLMVAPVNEAYRLPVPANYNDRPMMDRLYVKRSKLPAITHVDFSARVQAVNKETNPRYHELISAFGRLTDTYLLVNTSFNVRGEPIVCTPDDAYRCFMRTEMDYLVVGDYLFAKKDQPDWKDSGKWKEEFKPD
jgi:carbamoyltransferase